VKGVEIFIEIWYNIKTDICGSERQVALHKSVRIVAANWDKLIRDGYWNPTEQRMNL